MASNGTSTVAGPYPEGAAPVRERRFVAVSLSLFVASAAATVWACRSMPGGMPMPGGWTMSMAWMRMPGQTWLGAAAMFMAMWVVMMVAMMVPSLMPMLSTYRRSTGAGGARLDALTALAAAGYFFVWTLVGAVAYPVGLALAGAAMRWPAFAGLIPAARGVTVLVAGCVQLTAWKARHLGTCRESSCCASLPASGPRAAWRHGLHLGRHCSLCCSGLMTILLVGGVMDLGVMSAVAGAITIERLAPWPGRTARAIGLLAVAAGVALLARALAPMR